MARPHSFPPPEFRRERARKAVAARESTPNLLRKLSGRDSEELAAGARMLTPAEAAKIRAVFAALPTEGADGS